MAQTQREKWQFAMAVLIFAGAGALVWQVDSAMTYQHQVLGGCWPEKMYYNDTAVLTTAFWDTHVRDLQAASVAEFFLSRMNHRILLYLLIACSIIGWSGSVFRDIISDQAPARRSLMSSWRRFVALFFLAGLAGAILFLLLVSTRLLLDVNGQSCISQGYSYLSAASAIACGLFVIPFYDWFEKWAPNSWRTISNWMKGSR